MAHFELHFELEPDCILTCKHCSSQSIKKGNIQYEEKDLLRLVKAVDPCEIYFTGGEPLLFERLLPLFSSISEQFPACRLGLFTTGIIQSDRGLAPVEQDYLTQLYQAGLRVCYVSLYDDEENWHDYMTNTPGSFKKTVQAIENMISAGIDTRINLVVARFNSSRIRDIIHSASKLKISEVRLLKLIQHGNAANYWNTIGLSDEEYLKVIASVYTSRDVLPTRITFSSIPKLDPCRPLSNSCGCQARKNLLYVTLNGDIYPCACVKNDDVYLICNLKDTHLEQLVNMNIDQKHCYSSCLAESNNLEVHFDEVISDLVSKYFSKFLCMSKSEEVVSAIKAFLTDAKSSLYGIDFFELIFKKNQKDCLYYEVHTFFVKSVEKGKGICYVIPGVDIHEVYSICEKKFPQVQMQYQIINSSFVDQYIKDELLRRLVNSFDSLAFDPENYSFVKKCLNF